MRFFLQINGQTEGPFSVEEVEDLHGAGRVNRGTPCRSEGGSGEWSSIYNLVPSAIWVTHPQNRPPRISNDPPERRGFSKNILWIVLVFAVVLLLSLPLLVIAVEGLVYKESKPQLQALVPQSLTDHRGSGINSANLDGMNRQIDESARTFAGLLGFVLVLQISLTILGLVSFAFWIWMLITVVTTEPEGSDKVVWTILVVFTGPIGALIYFFARYRKNGASPYAS